MNVPPVTRDLTLEEMSTLVIQNNEEFLLRIGSATGTPSLSSERIRWIVGNSPIDYHNCVVDVNVETDECDSVILEFIAQLRISGVPGSWHVTEKMRPSDIRQRLESRGFVLGATEPGMIFDTKLGTFNSARIGGLRFAIVSTDRELDQWVATLGTGFGEGEVEAQWVGTAYRDLRSRGDENWTHILATRDGINVGTASLFQNCGVMGIYFVYITPYARKQGIGSEIVRYSTSISTSKGYRYCTLTASEVGAKLYRRLGFKVVTKIDVFEYRNIDTISL